MDLKTADEVYEQVVKELPASERRRLAERITLELSGEREAASQVERRAWSEIRGTVGYPFLGEDAQEWVSRTRRESDEEREKQWRRE